MENPFGLSDLFHFSHRRNIGRAIRLTDAGGHETEGRSRSYNFHYSVPFGKWLLAFNHSDYRYHEAVEGYNSNYDYGGKSISSNVGLSRILYRDGRHKTIAAFKLWRNRINKYIDDSEIEVQRRRTAGWEFEMNHKAQLGRYTLHAGVGYRRGTGMQDSMKAPEEYNENNDIIPGTSRMRIITANLSAASPLRIGKQLVSWDSSLNMQWNKTPLVPQDKFAIGGRYTVRGFDGEQSLIGEKGWYLQNNLNWHFLPGHQAYVGLDAGRVSGISTFGLPEQKLVGTVFGFKGMYKFGGLLQYDISAAKPVSKPYYFKTDSPVYSFNLNYSF